MVILPRADEIPERAEQHREPPHQTRPIHALGRDFRLPWPEREEKPNDRIHKPHDIGQRAPPPHAPGPEARGFLEEALAEHEGDGDHVGSEHAGDAEGDDGVEGGAGTDVDESEEEADGHRDADRVQGQRAARFDFGEPVGTRQAVVAGEGPGHAGGGGDEADGGEIDEGEDDAGHCGGAAGGVCGLQEDFHEGVTRGGFLGGFDVAGAEEDGDEGGETEDAVEDGGGDHGFGHHGRGVLDFLGCSGIGLVSAHVSTDQLGRFGKTWSYPCGKRYPLPERSILPTPTPRRTTALATTILPRSQIS